MAVGLRGSPRLSCRVDGVCIVSRLFDRGDSLLYNRVDCVRADPCDYLKAWREVVAVVACELRWRNVPPDTTTDGVSADCNSCRVPECSYGRPVVTYRLLCVIVIPIRLVLVGLEAL